MNILLLSQTPPWPSDTGGKQRTGHLFKALSEFGHVDLALFGIHGTFSNGTLTQLKKNFNLVGCITWHTLRDRLPFPFRFISESLNHRLSPFLEISQFRFYPYKPAVTFFNHITQKKKYDLVVSRHGIPAFKTNALIHHPIIIDVDDVESSVYRTHSNMSGISLIERLLLIIKSKRNDRLFKEKIINCDHLWVASEKDRKLFEHHSTSVLPNIPHIPDVPTNKMMKSSVAGEKIILIVGAMTYSPNRSGVNLFLNNVWPLVMKAHPDAVFQIVGETKNEDIKLWKRFKNVEPLGYVPSIKQIYQNASFTVAPIYYGGGTKIKVLESYLHNRPCVVTPHSHYGYETILKHGESLFCADSFKKMADYCIQLLNSSQLTVKMANNGKQLVKQYFNYNIFKKQVEKSIEHILT